MISHEELEEARRNAIEKKKAFEAAMEELNRLSITKLAERTRASWVGVAAVMDEKIAEMELRMQLEPDPDKRAFYTAALNGAKAQMKGEDDGSNKKV